MIRFLREGFQGSPDIVLAGDICELRPTRPADFREWSELRRVSRDFLIPWEPLWPADALSRRAFARRCRRAATDWHAGEAYAFHVFCRQTRKLVGGIGLSNVRRGVAQTGTIGYWVGQPYARRGYTGCATRVMLDFAFRDLGLHRVEAACLPRNEASRRLLETLGFTREGYARKYLRINGSWEDHVLYSMLAEDWRR